MKAIQLNKPKVNVHPIHSEWRVSHLLPFAVTDMLTLFIPQPIYIAILTAIGG
jgi:hypothetical protein